MLGFDHAGEGERVRGGLRKLWASQGVLRNDEASGPSLSLQEQGGGPPAAPRNDLPRVSCRTAPLLEEGGAGVWPNPAYVRANTRVLSQERVRLD